ncbi:MAG TPA: hypothetical protein VJW73_05240 [Gemmatimonadaceae bacterium]|nr:hypothetical protein [Gemmatimonadaceae bacterium]
MQRLVPTIAAFGLVLVAGAGCAHTSHMPEEAPVRTVLKVENQGFPDMNIFVLPETSNRIRLGTVTGTSNAYFTLPATVVRGVRELRFQALPIATPRGPVSQSIVVTPGDTVVLTIPPM